MAYEERRARREVRPCDKLRAGETVIFSRQLAASSSDFENRFLFCLLKKTGKIGITG